MTSLRLGPAPPTPAALYRYACRTAPHSREINHNFADCPLDADTARVIRITGSLGNGKQCYRRAKKMLLEWRMHEGSDTTGVMHTANGAVVTWSRMLPGLLVFNPCRELAPMVGRRHATVAYATTRGHLLAGTERMSVRWDLNGEVCFELLSVSRGAGVGRFLFPFLAPAQHRFFKEQLRCMQLLSQRGL